MNTEMSVSSICELIERWEALHCDKVKKGKVAISEFQDLFSATYLMLEPLAEAKEISKEYMPLILTVAHFAKSSEPQEDSVTCAAAVLTERMLQHCVINSGRPASGMTSIYSLKGRKEVIVSFHDVKHALDEIAHLIAANKE